MIKNMNMNMNNKHKHKHHHHIIISWVIAEKEFGQILGMPRREDLAIIFGHNLPKNREMIISWKFPPNSIIFDRVIA